MSGPRVFPVAFRSLGLAALSWALLAAAQSSGPFKVTSSLEGTSTLPTRVKWLVTSGVDVWDIESVTFLIDGKTRWVERGSPYEYGGAAERYLITTWLTPGKHTFTSKVTTLDGRTALNTVTATVAKPPAPPAALAGMWARTRTDANPQLSGRWNIIFDEVGAWVTDPQSSGVVEHIRVAGNVISVSVPIQMGLDHIGVPAYGAKVIFGHLCEDEAGSDGTFRWSVQGDRLTLRAIRPGCGNRQSLWEGTWTRVKNPPPRGPLLPVAAK